MAITTYKSSDGSAPAIGGAVAGDLITLFDAVLVNGYGAKSAAGWTKDYTGTNKAIYKQGTGSTGQFVRVDDTGALQYSTTIKCSVEASAVDTQTKVHAGVNSAGSALVYFRKPSTVANSGEWVMYADAKAFWLLTAETPLAGVDPQFRSYSAAFCGDSISLYQPGTDSWRFMLLGQNNTPGDAGYSQLYNMHTTNIATCGYRAGTPDGWVDGGLAISMGTLIPSFMYGAFEFPSYTAEGVVMTPLYVFTQQGGWRNGYELIGRLPGVYYCPQSYLSLTGAITNGTSVTFSSGDMNGKTVEARWVGGAGYGTSNARLFFFETSDTWGN